MSTELCKLNINLDNVNIKSIESKKNKINGNKSHMRTKRVDKELQINKRRERLCEIDRKRENGKVYGEKKAKKKKNTIVQHFQEYYNYYYFVFP